MLLGMAQCVCSCCSEVVFQVPHLGVCPKPFPESIPSWSWAVCWFFLVCCFPYRRKPGVQRAPSFGPLYLFPSTFSPDVFLPGSGLSTPPWRCSWHSPPHHMPRTCNSNITIIFFYIFFFLQEITHFPSRTTSLSSSHRLPHLWLFFLLCSLCCNMSLGLFFDSQVHTFLLLFLGLTKRVLLFFSGPRPRTVCSHALEVQNKAVQRPLLSYLHQSCL